MHRPSTAVRSAHHSGFTLMEMLIVIALLVAITTAVAPNLIERLRDSQVHRGADSVREVLSEARMYAIDSGIDYQFRYEIDGQFFVVLPTELEPTISNSLTADAASSEYMRLSGELQDTLFLRSLPDAENSAARLESKWFGGLPDAGVLSQKTWSAPIYFHIDGSATDHTFRVMDDAGRTAELKVRGLTGAVRMSPVFTESQS